jgi:tRNA 2-thiouridine synthesizing protein A
LPSEAGIFDLKGLKCPLPVLKARKRLRAMQAGERLWLETTDPLAVIDIPAFCAEDGHRLVESATAADGHRFLVERGDFSPP